MSYVWNVPTKVLFGAGTAKELAKEEMPGKKKVYQSLGILGGILLAVLVW